ncbi:MAG: 3-hydroxyacyl-[acyl-carrier-protein] dehydratase [bacterium]|jgi:3-hydroxyacyl-[acyl-carrier-protein] dehydratase
MLRDDLYTVVDLDENEAQVIATIAFKPTHDIFGGHFPENPMVPGVVLLKIVHELLEHHGKINVRLVAIKQSKFLAIINPNVHRQVKITWKVEHEDNQLNIKATGLVDTQTFFKLSAVFGRIE